MKNNNHILTLYQTFSVLNKQLNWESLKPREKLRKKKYFYIALIKTAES